MKKQIIFFINLSLLFISTGCASQNLTQKKSEYYDVINLHFNRDNKIALNKNTTNDFVNESILKDLDMWNEANTNLENINREDIDFHKLFDQEEFKKDIESFLSMERIRLEKKLVSPNIELKHNSNNTISFPYIFTSNKNIRYALLYGETINGPENGSGAVYLYEKRNNTWGLSFIFTLWIS